MSIRVAVALLTFGLVAPAGAQDSLTLWLLTNEPGAERLPPSAELQQSFQSWLDRGIDLFGNWEGVSKNPQYARLVAGQIRILDLLQSYRQSHPGAPRIAVRFFTWEDYFQKLQQLSGEGADPDVVQVPSTWAPSLVGHFGILWPGIHLDLAARRRLAPQLQSSCGAATDQGTAAIPWLVDVRVLYFWRRDLPGLDRDLASQHDRREAFRRALRTAKPGRDLVKAPFALPTARDWELLHQTALLVWGGGADLLTPRREFLFNFHSADFQAAALQGGSYIRSLLSEGLIDLPRISRDQLEKQFLEHRYSSVISGPWLATQLRKQLGRPIRDDIGITLPPFGGKPVATFVGGSCLGDSGHTAMSPLYRARAFGFG